MIKKISLYFFSSLALAAGLSASFVSQHVLFLRVSAATALETPEEFLQAYPIEKAPPTYDASGEEIAPAEFYTIADGLSIWEAVQLHGGYVPWHYDGTTLSRPRPAVVDAEGVEISPEIPVTHFSFVLNDRGGELMIPFAMQFIAYAQAGNTPMDPSLALQPRSRWAAFTANVQ